MITDIKISQLSSLNFSNWKHSFQKEENYIQAFIWSDIIRVQLSIRKGANLKVYIIDMNTSSRYPVDLTLLKDDDAYNIYYFNYRNLPIGYYTIEINNYSDETILSSCFRIVSKNDIDDMIRIRYTHRENIFDAIFINNDDSSNIFDFRVEGGFLYKDFQFKVETNDFRDQQYNNWQLSAYPHEVRKLTIGTSKGVPIWVARKLNLILSLSDFTINGASYARSEGSEPEISVIENMYPLYVYKIDLEPFDFYSEWQREYPFVYPILGTENNNMLGTENEKTMLIENN